MCESASLILDVDTGIDDALAIALAVRWPAVILAGITTVAGNVGIEHTTENTLRVLGTLGAHDIPVYRGFSRPLARELLEARDVHGTSGLGGYELPPVARRAEPMSAIDFLIGRIMDAPGTYTLVCTGPLTNLAAAIAVEPRVASALRRLVLMGGTLGRGNVTPYAEFNMHVDPDAAHQVFRSCEATMVGLDVTHRTTLSRVAWQRLNPRGSATERLVHGVTARSFQERGLSAVPLHDPLALAVAIDPGLCTFRRGTVTVETATAWRVGQTILSDAQDGPHTVTTDVDPSRFLERFSTQLGLPDLRTTD